MANKRRRGSSTRKYKIPFSCPIKKEAQVKVSSKKASKADEQRALILKIEAHIRSGRNLQGQPLTDKEIGVALTNISMLEHQLGIKHYQ